MNTSDAFMKTNGTPCDGNGTGGLDGSAGKDDAQWTALRYVLGEMNADEAEAFERTLATDLAACEQVAAAASLATNLYTVLATEIDVMTKAAPSMPAKPAPISAPVRSARRGLWAVVGLVAAVCLLAAGGLSLLPFTSDDQEQVATDRADASAGSLVAIWSERSAETAAEAPSTAGAGGDRANVDDALSFADADDVAGDLATDSVLIADDDYDVPGWLIAAVSPDSSATEIREN
jgi:anti-sigma factor RsiW